MECRTRYPCHCPFLLGSNLLISELYHRAQVGITATLPRATRPGDGREAAPAQARVRTDARLLRHHGAGPGWGLLLYRASGQHRSPPDWGYRAVSWRFRAGTGSRDVAGKL